ncbi:hypothetical protein B0H11DRAFT_2066035 [Mycena galericulata]|nr:hypothetical protein B0H11DRAFT_2066035 [Mycena galericulata]
MDWKAFCKLYPAEERFCKYHAILKHRGYELRARYQPDWIPECERDPLKHPLLCEDTLHIALPNCMDATRIDGAPVLLKFVDSSSTESAICLALTRMADPHNHTIPADVSIPLPDDPDSEILVMARMRDADDPPFETVGEVLEFLQQVFEGVEFMHRCNVAHCDISIRNMVMDTKDMIPGGFHPINTLTEDGLSKDIHIRSRTSVAPVTYYFIDFGLAVAFKSYVARSKVTGIAGRHRNIPELSADIPYDPFKLDIRQIGETIKTELLANYWGLECLIPLMRRLRKDDPDARPDAVEALRLFESLAAKIDATAAAAKLIPRKGFQPIHWVNHSVASTATRLRP